MRLLNECLYAPLLIIAPAVVGGVLHSLAIKGRLLSSLAVPLSERWFGRHKTYRGFVVMSLACVIGVYVAVLLERQLPPEYWVGFNGLTIWLEGLSLGFAYMAFELPNSFLKRRFGIQEGRLGTGGERWPFLLADQADSVIGCVLVCWVFFDVTMLTLLSTVVIGVGGHMATNLALFLAGVRSRPL